MSKIEQLNKLEPKKKAMVFGGTLLGLFVVFQMLLIGPANSEAESAEKKVEQLQAELKKIIIKPKKKKVVDPSKDPVRLKAQVKSYAQRLKKGGAYPNLVTHLKERADKLGLKITKIFRDEPYVENYVRIYPVRIEAVAHYPVFVTFLKQLSEESDRLLLISNLTLNRRSLSSFYSKGAMGARLKKSNDMTEEDVARNRIAELDAYSEAAKRSTITIKFSVDAYSYTGKALTAAQRKVAAKRKKKGRRKGH
jgi:Tfp pilus assembly protein PilO